MNPELELFCGRVLSALGTGLYQGLVLTAVIWLGLKLLPRSNAATRHAVGMVTLVLVAALPIVHFLKPAVVERRETGAESDQLLPTRILGAMIEGSVPPNPEPVMWPDDVRWEPEAVMSEESSAGSLEVFAEASAMEESIPEGAAVSEMEADAADEPVAVLREASEVVPVPVQSWEMLRGKTEAMLARIPEIPVRLEFLVPKWTAVCLVGLWVLLGGVRLAGVAWQCWRLWLLKRGGTAVAEEVQGVFRRVCDEMGVRRRARLLSCGEIASPMAAGFWKPAVLLPTAVIEQANGSQIEHLLRHEAAHLRRGDDWANLVQQVIRATLFFHPGVWWLSRRVTLDREIACDDHVLASTGAAQAYALLLTEFAGRMRAHEWAAAPAAWSRKSQLKERIGMILDQKRNATTGLARTKLGLMTAAGVLVATLVWQSGPRLAFAQESGVVAVLEASAEDGARVTVEAETPAKTKPARVTLERTGPETAPRAPRAAIGPASVHLVAPAPHPAPAPVAHPEPMREPKAVAVLSTTPVSPRTSISVTAAPRIEKPRVSVAVTEPVLAQVHPVPGEPRGFKPGPAPRKAGGEPLERRVERLERMIESLTGDRKQGAVEWNHDMHLHFEDGHEKHAEGWAGHEKTIESEFKFGPKAEELERIHKQAEKMALQAARQSEQLAREAQQRAMRYRDGKGEERRDALEIQRRSLQVEARRAALEQELRGLAKQMERVEGMLDEIEDEQEMIEEQVERERERIEKEEEEVERRERKARDDSGDAQDVPEKRAPKTVQ